MTTSLRLAIRLRLDARPIDSEMAGSLCSRAVAVVLSPLESRDMTDHPTSSEIEQHEPTIEKPRLANWVWRPWYAKLWWSLITVHWTAAVGALLFGPLRNFYGSDLAGYLNIALHPVFAFFILSIGWMIAWKEALDYAAAHPEIENMLGWEWQPFDFQAEHEHRIRQRNDPSNPASPGYIANETLRRMFDR